ncbi:outer membrane protein assembly factor BamA [Rhodocaloribacter sp.]
MSVRLLLFLGWLLGSVAPVLAQTTLPPDASPPRFTATERPRTFTIVDITVEGVEDGPIRDFVKKVSGLRVGQEVEMPHDAALAEAVRALYRVGLFSDVKILEAAREGRDLRLILRVTEAPRLAGYTFEGLKEKDARALEREIMLFPGSIVRPGDVERAEQVVRQMLRAGGYPLAEVNTRQTEAEGGGVTLVFVVKRGPRVEVAGIEIKGNEALSDDALRKRMATKTRRWWRFWRKATFDPATYRSDLDRIVAYYNEQGYYDARIVRDTSFVRTDEGDPEMVIEVEVEEGPRYHVRRVEWAGNTVLTDAELTEALGLRPGDPYNGRKLEENLYFNEAGTDVASRYMNRGHLRFNVTPDVRVVEGDSLDLHFDLFEGEVYTFGVIAIAGNRGVNEHVVRRELATLPGRPFSRAAIQESLVRLMRTGYFSPEALGAGPEIRVDDEHKTVDVIYRVEEVHKNPVSFGGSYSGGLLLQVGLNMNNFSLRNLFRPSKWNPLPTGDGQRFSLGVQTGGADFQVYSLDFTEPWFRGKPNPLGFSTSFAHIADGFRSDEDLGGSLDSWSFRTFHDHRLSRRFSMSTGLRLRSYDNRGWTTLLPEGRSLELVFAQSFTRSTLDHPLFPRRGTMAQLSVEVAPPLSNVQYHKWRLRGKWQVPLTKTIGIGLSADWGYTGSLTGEDVGFQRFLVGGSPIDAQGFEPFFGQDIVYMRGYPSRVIGPRDADGSAAGGRLLNKYSLELGWMAVQKPQLTVMPYLFFDAANTWRGFDDYRPTDLFSAAGIGMRVSLPILGLVEFSYGYNLDTYAPLNGHDGSRGWRFQISLGRTFNF